MDKMILGYQYGPVHGEYRGTYEFPNNLDKEDIHVPPFTTLVKPPKTAEGMVACWDGSKWVEKVDDDKSSIKVKPIPDEEIGKLTPEFVEHRISIGLWSPELQAKHEVAKKKHLKQEQDDIEAIRQKAIKDAMEIKRIALEKRAANPNTPNT